MEEYYRSLGKRTNESSLSRQLLLGKRTLRSQNVLSANRSSAHGHFGDTIADYVAE